MSEHPDSQPGLRHPAAVSLKGAKRPKVIVAAKKMASPFGGREWVSTSELAAVYGHSVDFWQKLAKAGAFETKRNGFGERARYSVNVESFLEYWNTRADGKQCQKSATISPYTNVPPAKFGGCGRGAKARSSASPSIQRIRALAGKGLRNG